MAIREFEPASASISRDEPATAPLFNSSGLARTSGRPRTRVSRLLSGVLAGLLAAAAVLAAGYWCYRQIQPTSLFMPASEGAERAAIPAAPAGGASERQR